MNTPGSSVSGYGLLLFIQLIFLAVFGIYTDYDDELKPKNVSNGTQTFSHEAEGSNLSKYARKFD